MTIITIPKKIARNEDLIAIPRKEYEALLVRRKHVAEFVPTEGQKTALRRAEDNLRKGKTLTYNELAKKLGFRS